MDVTQSPTPYAREIAMAQAITINAAITRRERRIPIISRISSNFAFPVADIILMVIASMYCISLIVFLLCLIGQPLVLAYNHIR
jgi:hypothetical protein